MTHQFVNKQEVNGVFSTKKGLHEFYSVELEFFLPPLPYTNIDLLRDISSGRKKVCSSQFPWSNDMSIDLEEQRCDTSHVPAYPWHESRRSYLLPQATQTGSISPRDHSQWQGADLRQRLASSCKNSHEHQSKLWYRSAWAWSRKSSQISGRRPWSRGKIGSSRTAIQRSKPYLR